MGSRFYYLGGRSISRRRTINVRGRGSAAPEDTADPNDDGDADYVNMCKDLINQRNKQRGEVGI